MTIIDIIVSILLIFFIYSSMLNGLIVELLSLKKWFISFYIAFCYYDMLSKYFISNFSSLFGNSVILNSIAAFIIIFILVFMLINSIAILFTKIFSYIGLGIFNRILGAIFGFLKAIFFISIAVLMLGFTNIPQHEVWKNSFSIVYFENLVNYYAVPFLPKNLQDKIKF